MGREPAELLVALSAAVQRAQIYPGGHPTVDRAVDAVLRRLAVLLEGQPSVAFAVSPAQLTVAGAVTDPDHPLLRDLAMRLFRRNVGMVRFSRGVARAEVESLLAALSREVIPAAPPRTAHLEIELLNFAALGLEESSDAGTDGGRSRAAEVWSDLARLATSCDSAPPDARQDDAVLAGLAATAEACRDIAPAESWRLRRQLSTLLGGLRPETLRRLLSRAEPAGSSRPVLDDLVDLTAAPVALDLLLAAAQVEQRTLSPALVQLLTKLASHAEVGPSRSRRLADQQFRETLHELIEEWRAPEADEVTLEYQHTLDHLPVPLVPDLDPTEAYRSDPLRIVTMHLDMGDLGLPAARAVRTLVARGRIRPLVDLLERLSPTDPLAESFRGLVATPDALTALLAARPVDVATLERLAPEAGTAAIPPLLDALAASDDRGVRRRVLELLARFGNTVTPHVLGRLVGAPWFVQRNFLRLLQALPDPPAEAGISGYALDTDPRVRVEGLRLLLRLPAARSRGIVQGLADPDPSCQRVAVLAAVDGCPPAAAPLLLRRVVDHSLDPELRPAAIRALGELVEEPSVLELLLALAARRVPVLGLRLAPKSRDSLTALATLARHWRWHPRTARLLARAERHRDAEVRAAVSGPSVLEQLGVVPEAG
jgi:HEAT repeat protein